MIKISASKTIFAMALVSVCLMLGCGKSTIPQFKIATSGEAVYRVAFEDLPSALVKKKHMPIATMALFHHGNQVPIWVTDNGDDRFGPGDAFEFLARHLPGDLAYAHEYARTDAYHLRFDVENPLRTVEAQVNTAAEEPATTYRGFQHFEQDKLLMRFASYDFSPYEIWYWQKLSCTDRKPFVFDFSLPDFKTQAEPLQIRLNLRGWSRIRGKGLEDIPDHELVATLNGETLGTFHWDEREPHMLTIQVPHFQPPADGTNQLTLSVPRRTLPNGQLAIDVVMLNWIEMTYAQTPQLQADPKTFRKGESSNLAWVQTLPEAQTLLGDGGTRVTLPGASDRQFLTIPPTDDTFFVATGTAGPKKAKRIVPWFGGRLKDPQQQADYVMVTHPRLKDAIEPLATYHREQGKTVSVVDVRHIYDNFNHGVVHPKAIREFLAHAYHEWQKPAPKFVLLVGDASWDAKNNEVRSRNYSDAAQHRRNATSFSKVLATTYDENDGRNDRNLIPTANFFDNTGHSASDNYFVKVAGDDQYPDMAIGRFPVTKPEEVAHIVAKTIAYDQQAPVGPWRRKILMITNEDAGNQRRTDLLAKRYLPQTNTVEKIYPASKDKSNETHTRSIVEAMNGGQNIIFFYGHGGRFIWRTGPPDIKKNHDLFTLNDLDTLAENSKLPIVLSMTCYSAPFDHPNADSIGEKFLRLENRGAVSFIGASWRNAPMYNFITALVKAYTQQSGTVGEALMTSKAEIPNRTMVETYNLLGDPAVKLLKPATPFNLALAGETAQAWVLEGTITEGSFSGQGLAEMKFDDKTVAEAVSFEVNGDRFRVQIKKPTNLPLAFAGFQVYLWDEAAQKDWFAVLEVAQGKGTGHASQP